MKRISKIIIAFILFFTFTLTTQAKDCTIISGTGKNIGDEIACGTEHFYVIENDGTNAKLLAKYNLMAGASYEYIELDSYETENFDEIYLMEEIKAMLDKGYYLWYDDYDWSYQNKKYTIYGVSFMDEYLRDDQTIWFETSLENIEEVVKNTEVKKLLESGYNIYETIIINDKYKGIQLYKYEYEDSKIVYLDKTPRNYMDLYQIGEIKELLDDGYYYNEKLYDNMSCTAETGCKYEYFAVTLSKDSTEMNQYFMFDEKVTTYTEVEQYIANNDKVQKILDDGYDYTTIGDSYYDNTTSSYKYIYYGIRLYKEKQLDYQEYIHQDKKAIGIHGDEFGNPDYPMHGVINDDDQLYDFADDETRHVGESYGGGYYQDIDTTDYLYFNWYKDTLAKEGYTIKDIGMPTVNDINNAIKEITGSEIPLEEWYANKEYVDEFDIYLLGSIKTLLEDKHPWLYSTAYWLETKPTEEWGYLFEINTLGDLCASSLCKTKPGTGIRPLITLASDNIKYEITTKVTGEGKLTASHETADPDYEITFEVKPAEGYVLGEIKVTDEDGNVITFTDYKFTMPSANVIIEATFVPYNPDTADRNIIIISILIMIGAYLIIKNNKKLSWLK